MDYQLIINHARPPACGGGLCYNRGSLEEEKAFRGAKGILGCNLGRAFPFNGTLTAPRKGGLLQWQGLKIP